MKKILAAGFVFSIFVMACVSYDAPVIYHKNFQPGAHDSLRFDGFYTQYMEDRIKPFFLYRNGSVWFGELFTPRNIATVEFTKKDPAIAHSWGNYKVDGDTIYIERFHKAETSDNYNRITMKGIIHSTNIQWIQREEDRMNPVKVNYLGVFEKSATKPDSTLNWTRTRVQYNK